MEHTGTLRPPWILNRDNSREVDVTSRSQSCSFKNDICKEHYKTMSVENDTNMLVEKGMLWEKEYWRDGSAVKSLGTWAQFSAPTWLLRTICNSSFRISVAIHWWTTYQYYISLIGHYHNLLLLNYTQIDLANLKEESKVYNFFKVI